MVTKFQFETVEKLIDSGVDNYVLIRQQAGLTSDELDDILANVDYYKEYFAVHEPKESTKPKKHWWQR
jgi:hypothetical protein